MAYSKDQHGRSSGENSDFQKDLLAIVDDYEQEVEDAKATKDAFDGRWRNTCGTAIKPVFKETKDRLDHILNLTYGEENGHSYILRHINRHVLKYTADQEKDRIICSGAGLAEEDAEFELSLLTRRHVEAHVKTFVNFCLRHSAD
jgi:hypothetical protein